MKGKSVKTIRERNVRKEERIRRKIEKEEKRKSEKKEGRERKSVFD